MKKLLVASIVSFVLFSSCEKEDFDLNKIGCECNDGAKIPSLNQSDCSSQFTITEQVLLKDSKGNAIYPTTYVTVKRTSTHKGFKQFLYGKGTFCDNFGNSIYCLGKNY
jgi:hypothetical protein